MRREPFDVIRELETFAKQIKEQFEQRRETAAESSPRSSSGEWPAVNVSYDDDAIYVEADVPGVHKGDVTVSMRGTEAIEISGRRMQTPEQTSRENVRRESPIGDFRRVIQLPDFAEVNSDGVSASMEEGVLRIRLPRRDAAQRRTVEIN